MKIGGRCISQVSIDDLEEYFVRTYADTAQRIQAYPLTENDDEEDEP